MQAGLVLCGGFGHARVGVDAWPGDALDPGRAALVPARRLTPRARQSLLGGAGEGRHGVVLSRGTALAEPANRAQTVAGSLPRGVAKFVG